MKPTSNIDLEQAAALALGMSDGERRAFLDSVFVTDVYARAVVESRVRALLQAPGEPDAALPLGESAQRYRIVELIGRGGMGSVYLAERSDGEFVQRVALKTLNSEVDQNAGFLSRFAAERQILAHLSHPNIARLLDGGRDERGVPYLVMEYVDGVPLDVFCKEQRLGTEARVRLFLGVLAAVQAAHQTLVVHRDIKPANILVTRDGVPKLLDFGVAKLLGGEAGLAPLLQTQTGHGPMTPRFAAPEQVLSQPITVAVDIYALGVVLYELLAGVSPYPLDQRNAAGLALAIASIDPPAPSSRADQQGYMAAARSLRGDLDAILLKALRKQPQDRYASVQALADDLRCWLDGLPVQARQGSLAYQLRRRLRRHWLPAAAMAAVLLALVLSAWTWRAERDAVARERDSAAATADLLTELITRVDPTAGAGFALSARELIDEGAARISIDASIPPLVRERLLSTLGQVYLNLGEPSRAAPFLEQSWREDGSAQSAIDLARLRVAQARYPEVAELLRGLDAPSLAPAQLAQARALRIESDLALGRIEAGREALLDWIAALQRDPQLPDEERALAWINAGRLSLPLRDLAFCRDTLARAERVSIDAQPPNPRLLTEVRLLQAGCENQGGDLDRAVMLGEEALQRVREQFGPAHPRVAEALLHLSEPLVLREDHVRAIAMMDDARAILRASSNTRNEVYANVLLELARIARTERDFALARQLSSEAIELLRSLPNVRPDNLARALNNHGLLLTGLGELEQAVAHYEEAAAIMQPLQLPSEAFLYANLGRFYCDELKQPEPGAERLRKAIRLIEERRVGDDWLGATVESSLGVCLAMAGDFAAAEPLLREAAIKLAEALGPDNTRTRNAEQRYHNLLAARARGETRADVQVYP